MALSSLAHYVDPRSTRKSRVSVGIGLISAFLIVGAFLSPMRNGEIAAGAAAGFVAISGVSWLVLATAEMHSAETRALWSLSSLFSDGALWPAPGDWALDAEAAVVLLKEIGVRGFRTVVELGPGSSSVIFGRAGAGSVEVFGIEHDPRFASLLDWYLNQHDLSNYTLLLAPLTPQPLDGGTIEWYDPAVIGRLPDPIDVLVVDGPPGASGRFARAAAWPLLRERMRHGGLILVDDTDRLDERRMIGNWVASGGVRVIGNYRTYALLEVE